MVEAIRRSVTVRTEPLHAFDLFAAFAAAADDDPKQPGRR
jgi:hypothetical protein